VPGISDRTAHTLLERFGSVGGVLNAGPERWAEVAGIGTVRAHALAEALLNGGADGGKPPLHGATAPEKDPQL
jgi:ERCC4-type nuclease